MERRNTEASGTPRSVGAATRRALIGSPAVSSGATIARSSRPDCSLRETVRVASGGGVSCALMVCRSAKESAASESEVYRMPPDGIDHQEVVAERLKTGGDARRQRVRSTRRHEGTEHPMRFTEVLHREFPLAGELRVQS